MRDYILFRFELDYKPDKVKELSIIIEIFMLTSSCFHDSRKMFFNDQHLTKFEIIKQRLLICDVQFWRELYIWLFSFKLEKKKSHFFSGFLML